MIVVATQLVSVLLFTGIETNLIIVALKGGDNIGYLGFVDPQRNLNDAGLGMIDGIELGYLCVVGLYQLADLAK